MISGISIRDFLGLRDVALVIDRPLVFFQGANGVGKTAVRDAIVWAINGRCRGVATKKEAPEELIRDGAKRCEVVVQFGPDWRLERALTTSGSETLRLVEYGKGGEDLVVPGTKEELQAELYRRLGVDEKRALAALDSWAAFGLDDERRVELLFRAAGSATAEQIEAGLAKRGLSGDVAHQAAQIAATRGFRAAEKHAEELRREAGRKLKDLPEVRSAPRLIRVDGEERDLEHVTTAQLEDGLARAKESLRDAERVSAESVGAARAEVARLKARVADLEATVDAPLPDPQPLRMRLTTREREADEAGRKIAELDETLAGARAVAALADGEIEHPGVCPKVAGEFLCPATKSGLETHARKLRKAAQEARETVERLAPERERLAALRAAASADADALRKEVKAAQDAGYRHENATTDLGIARGELAKAEKALADAEAATSAGAVDFARARVARIEPVLAAKRAYEEAKADTTPQRRLDLAAAHESADQLAKALSPEGVEADLLAEAIAPIRERLERTGRMLGRVTIRPDLALEVEVDGRRRTMRQLSRSQQLRLAIVLQDALAAVSGLPFLLVDEVDVFDAESRGVVLGVLRELATEHYGSVFAFSTLTKGRPMAPPVPDVGAVWIHDGTAEVVR